MSPGGIVPAPHPEPFCGSNGMSHARFFPVRGVLSLILCGILPVALLAQAARGPTIVRRDLHHDVSPPLIDMIRNAHPVAHDAKLEAKPRRSIPLPPGLQQLDEDPVRQFTTTGFSPQVGLNFEGIGDGQYGFTVEYIPPTIPPTPPSPAQP